MRHSYADPADYGDKDTGAGESHDAYDRHSAVKYSRDGEFNYRGDHMITEYDDNKIDTFHPGFFSQENSENNTTVAT